MYHIPLSTYHRISKPVTGQFSAGISNTIPEKGKCGTHLDQMIPTFQIAIGFHISPLCLDHVGSSRQNWLGGRAELVIPQPVWCEAPDVQHSTSEAAELNTWLCSSAAQPQSLLGSLQGEFGDLSLRGSRRTQFLPLHSGLRIPFRWLLRVNTQCVNSEPVQVLHVLSFSEQHALRQRGDYMYLRVWPT